MAHWFCFLCLSGSLVAFDFPCTCVQRCRLVAGRVPACVSGAFSGVVCPPVAAGQNPEKGFALGVFATGVASWRGVEFSFDRWNVHALTAVPRPNTRAAAGKREVGGVLPRPRARKTQGQPRPNPPEESSGDYGQNAQCIMLKGA